MSTNYYRIPSVDDLTKSLTKVKSKITTLLKDNNFDYFLYEEEFSNMEDILPTKVHIGKYSDGWQFLWDHNDWKYFKDKESLLQYVAFGTIIDEYGRYVSQEEFLELALNTKGWTAESYSKTYDARTYSDEVIIDGLRFSTKFF
jgi:hypothetical protein